MIKDWIFESDPVRPAPAAATGGVGQSPVLGAGAGAGSPEADAAEQALLDRVFGRDSSYTKLRRTYDGLGVIPDETLRFTSALAALKAQGITPEDIVRGVAVHEQDLQVAKSDFERTLQDRTHQLDKLRGKAKDVVQQIEAKQRELQALEEERAALDREAQGLESKQAIVRAGFEAAFARVRDRITQDRDRIAREGGRV